MSFRNNKQIFPAIYQSGFERITIGEIEQVFVNGLNSPRRTLLASHLRLFIGKLRSLGVKGELWIDGSFSTKNPNPMDIDLVLVISRSTLANMTEKTHEELDYLTSNHGREYVRTKWFCDFYVIDSSNIGDRKYYENLYSKNPDDLNKKGIPVIIL